MRLIIFFLFAVVSLEANYCIEVLGLKTTYKNLNSIIGEASSSKYDDYNAIRVESRGNYFVFRLGDYKYHKDALKDIALVQKTQKNAYIRKCDFLKEQAYYIRDVREKEEEIFSENAFWSSKIDKNKEAYYTLEKAYIADRKGKKSEAYRLFDEAASECTQASIYNKACLGTIMYHPLRQKYFHNPYYAIMYGEAVWFERTYKPETPSQQNFKDVVYQIKARAGRYLDRRKKTSVYLFAHLDGDTESKTGDIPIIYSENYAGLGVGLDYRPIKQARLFFETSIENNIISGNDKQIQYDYRLGAEYYNQWGPGVNLGCSYNPAFSFDWFSDLYLSAVAYSRYDNNIIFQGSTRLGARLINYKMSNISAYGRLGITADTNQDFFNNVVDIGPGIEWKPYQPMPLSIRTEYRFSKYFRDVGYERTDRFNTFLVYGIFYFEK